MYTNSKHTNTTTSSHNMNTGHIGATTTNSNNIGMISTNTNYRKFQHRRIHT